MLLVNIGGDVTRVTKPVNSINQKDIHKEKNSETNLYILSTSRKSLIIP